MFERAAALHGQLDSAYLGINKDTFYLVARFEAAKCFGVCVLLLQGYVFERCLKLDSIPPPP
jgi:hypothetical protein